MYVPRTILEDYSPIHRGLPMLFVHTPKCGGSFVSKAVHRHRSKCVTMTEPALRGHQTWQDYRSNLEAFDLSITDYTTFSVVRNPFSWHVSWFTYIRGPKGGKRSGYMLEHDLFQKMDFSNYVDWLEDPDAKRTKRFDMGRQVSDWVMDENGHIAVDYILRQEQLNSDLTRMAAELHLRLHIPTKPVNVSNPKQDYQNYYSSDTIEKIAQRHDKDLRLFGYSF